MEQPENWQPANLGEVRSLLGEPDAAFHSDWLQLSAGIIVGMLGCILGIILLFVPLGKLEWDVSPYAVGLPILLASIGALWLIHRVTSFQLMFYPQSLVLQIRWRVIVIPWEHIVEITQTHDVEGVVTLVRNDEPSVSFRTDLVLHPGHLSAKLAEEAGQRGIRGQIRSEPMGPRPLQQYAPHGLSSPLRSIQSSVDLKKLGSSAAAILGTAHEIARRQRCEYLGTEHVLLALLASAPNDATAILLQCGVSPDDMKRKIEDHIIDPSNVTMKVAELAHTPRLITACALAEEERVRHSGPIALLLGLVREDESIASVALAGCGVTESRVRTLAEPMFAHPFAAKLPSQM